MIIKEGELYSRRDQDGKGLYRCKGVYPGKVRVSNICFPHIVHEYTSDEFARLFMHKVAPDVESPPEPVAEKKFGEYGLGAIVATLKKMRRRGNG